MTDEDFEQCLRSAFGWCVLSFALLAMFGFMGWNTAYMVFQWVCAVACLIGLLVYAIWIALYGLRRLRG